MSSSQSPAQNTPVKPGKAAVGLLVLACLFSVLALTFTWVRNQSLNTDRYVQTVAPLATNPAIRSAVTDAVSRQIVTAVNPEQLIQQSLPPKAAPLAGPLAEAVKGFVHTLVGKLVSSKQFEQLWAGISRESHAQLVAVLTGKRTVLNTLAAKGQIKLDLSAVVGPAKAFLQSRNVDTTQLDAAPSLVIFDLSALQQAQEGVKALKGLTLLFTILAPLCFLGAVAASRSRRRTIIVAGLSLAGSMAVLGILLSIGRYFYLDSLSASVPKDAAAAFFDTLIRYFGTGIKLTALVGLAVALSAWWSGPGRKAAGSLSGEGLVPVLRVAVIGIGAIVLLTVSHPSAVAILLGIALIALLAVAIGPVINSIRK